MGWSVGRGCPLPTEERVWGGGCAPSREIFKNFLVQCVQKIFVFRPKGGHRPVPPPLNTPLLMTIRHNFIANVLTYGTRATLKC